MRFLEKIVTYRPSFTVRIVAGVVAFIAMLFACMVVGVGDQVSGLAEREAVYTARYIEQGARVYYTYCAQCHGPDGKGIEGLGPALNSEKFLGRINEKGEVALKSQRLADVGWTGTLRSYISSVTSAGIPIRTSNVWDVNHPTFSNQYGGPLRPDEIENVALFVQNWALDPATSGTVDAPKPGEGGAAKATAAPLTPEQEAGKAVYLKTGCSACHAIRGVGTQGAVGPNLNKIGAEAPLILTDPKFKYTGKATDGPGYIHESIVDPNIFIYPNCPTGACAAGIMPQTYSTQLKAEEINQLVAYLNSLK